MAAGGGATAQHSMGGATLELTDEEVQLQAALAASRAMAEKGDGGDGDKDDLAAALALSEVEAGRRADWERAAEEAALAEAVALSLGDASPERVGSWHGSGETASGPPRGPAGRSGSGDDEEEMLRLAMERSLMYG